MHPQAQSLYQHVQVLLRKDTDHISNMYSVCIVNNCVKIFTNPRKVSSTNRNPSCIPSIRYILYIQPAIRLYGCICACPYKYIYIPTCVFIKILDAFCDLYVPNKNDKQLIQFKQVSLYIQKEIWAWTSCACFVELHSTKKKHTSKFPCLTAASCLKMIKVQGARSRRRILLILRSGSANDLRIATSDGSNWQ